MVGLLTLEIEAAPPKHAPLPRPYTLQDDEDIEDGEDDEDH